MAQNRIIKAFVSFLSVFALPLSTTFISIIKYINSAHAADTLVVRYGPFTESITLAQLQTAAETGKLPNGYESYTSRLSQIQRNQLIGALQTKIPIGVTTVDRLLNTRIGTTILSDFATAVKRKDTAGVQALRGV